jgi:hypothetical protein
MKIMVAWFGSLGIYGILSQRGGFGRLAEQALQYKTISFKPTISVGLKLSCIGFLAA